MPVTTDIEVNCPQETANFRSCVPTDPQACLGCIDTVTPQDGFKTCSELDQFCPDFAGCNVGCGSCVTEVEALYACQASVVLPDCPALNCFSTGGSSGSRNDFGGSIAVELLTFTAMIIAASTFVF